MKKDALSRRGFLKGVAAAAAAVTIVPREAFGANEKVNLAGIGCGGKGGSDLNDAAACGANIVALCDVDERAAAGAFQRWPKAKRYKDLRKMLDEMEKEIDAVTVSTPDHMHFAGAMCAMLRGKHAFVQKPMTHNVWEAKRLAEVAREKKLATQMGIQGHSGEGSRLICEWIGAGLIGDVREVDAWCSLSYYPWGHAGWSSRWSERPKDTPPVPSTLNWDLWIGPAPDRPYHPAYHPAVWRCWWDFGCGMMGDRGAHTLDPVVWALKLGPPTSIDATTCGNTPEVHPLSAIVTFRFAARGQMPPVKVTWYEGTRPPRPEELEDGRRMPDEGGAIFIGTKGKIMCGVYGDGPRIIPEAKMKEAKLPEKTLPRVNGSHEMDWVRAIKTGQPAGADFAYSGPLTETCLLGNVAQRVDARIEWDAENLKVTNLAEANRYVRTEYRKGWSL